MSVAPTDYGRLHVEPGGLVDCMLSQIAGANDSSSQSAGASRMQGRLAKVYIV